MCMCMLVRGSLVPTHMAEFFFSLYFPFYFSCFSTQVNCREFSFLLPLRYDFSFNLLSGYVLRLFLFCTFFSSPFPPPFFYLFTSSVSSFLLLSFYIPNLINIDKVL
uniref:Uncharacterized protein n=1 Tax=Cacopsylla melanoneura TaxID=428564 RepID=A0A8D8VZZ8_9HEMI